MDIQGIYESLELKPALVPSPLWERSVCKVLGSKSKAWRSCGGQIDNELNCEVNVFYSAADRAAFRIWVQEKYGSLDALNRAWGTVFWSQTYTDWTDVRLTGPTPSDAPNQPQRYASEADSEVSLFAKYLQASLLLFEADRAEGPRRGFPVDTLLAVKEGRSDVHRTCASTTP